MSDLKGKASSFQINNQSDIDEQWNKFENIFSTTVYTHAPLRPMTKKEIQLQSKPWLTKGIIKSGQIQKKMYKKCITKGDLALSSEYKTYRNKLTKIKQLSKKLYFQKAIEESGKNSKKLWKTINNIINYKDPKNSSIDRVEDENGNFITEAEQISNLMNKNFVSLVDNLMATNQYKDEEDNHPPFNSDRVLKSFFLRPFTVPEITNYIKSLDSNKSSRSDLPKICFLKISVEVIAPLITELFNQCIVQSVFPTSLKLAEVIPIHKSGPKTNINNYRPISLLSPFSKLFETHLCNCLTDFFNKNNVIYKKQFGFKENSSTDLAVIDTVDHITTCLENDLTTCSVFLDLAKAFNTVNHSILLQKLEKYGIRGDSLKLIESYIRSRKQMTRVNSFKSKQLEINTGVPQGSCLGPLLFLIYINDIHLNTAFSIRLFADDASLSLSHSCPRALETNVNNELKTIYKWLQRNKLFLNFSKTNYLIFSKKKTKHNFTITMANNILKEEQTTKYLGVTIDHKLSWKPHLSKLRTDLARACYALNKLKLYLNYTAMKSVYYSLFNSKLQYCITSWGGCAPTNLTTIMRLQKRAVRSVCSKSYLAPTNPLFIQTKILKLPDLYHLNICKLVRKMLDGKLEGNLELTNINQIHDHNTRLRSANNFYPSSCSTDLSKSGFSYTGPDLWRTVPEGLKCLNHKSFGHVYKRHLIKCYENE